MVGPLLLQRLNHLLSLVGEHFVLNIKVLVDDRFVVRDLFRVFHQRLCVLEAHLVRAVEDQHRLVVVPARLDVFLRNRNLVQLISWFFGR